jgi:methionine-rich copper-binding protein CopC
MSRISNTAAKGSRAAKPWQSALLALSLAVAAPAHAGSVFLTNSGQPRLTRIDTGNGSALALRFDRPVDHASSRLVLISGNDRRAIKARLRSEPNVLYGSVGKLAPGHYELDWTARSLDGQRLSGRIPVEIQRTGG